MSDRTSTSLFQREATSAGTSLAFSTGTGSELRTAYRDPIQGTSFSSQAPAADVVTMREKTGTGQRKVTAGKLVDRSLVSRALSEVSQVVPEGDDYEAGVQLQNIRGLQSELLHDLHTYDANVRQVVVLLDSVFTQILDASAVSSDLRSLAIECLETLNLPLVPEKAIDVLVSRMADLEVSLLP